MEKRIENHPILGESPKGKLVKFSYDGTTLEGYEGELISCAAAQMRASSSGFLHL